jgi:hypothetical protein
VSVYLSGAFANRQAAIEAIQQLRAGGCDPEELSVFSDEPVELPRGVLDRPSHMSLAVVSGAVAFLLLSLAFVYFTQYNYRLVTGGMPIFSAWPIAVVVYEMTMLGAILTALAWFIWESGLLRRDKRVPVPKVDPEWVCLRVRCTIDRRDDIAGLLEKAGAQRIAKLEIAA